MKTLKPLFATLVFALLSVSLIAQETQVRKTTSFSEIDVSEGIFVELSMDKTQRVEVIADADIIDKVVTEVDGDELNIYMKGNNFKLRNKQVVVKVSATALSEIKASSGSSIISKNLIEADDLEIKVSSGASLKIAYKAPKSSCSASSGASVKLKGVTKFFVSKASSGSSISADELKAINVNADVSSGANISISVEDELIADASSGGSINYSGKPKMVDIDKSSGGSVSKH